MNRETVIWEVFLSRISSTHQTMMAILFNGVIKRTDDLDGVITGLLQLFARNLIKSMAADQKEVVGGVCLIPNTCQVFQK